MLRDSFDSRSPHLGAVRRIGGAVCEGERMVDAVWAWVGQVSQGHLSYEMKVRPGKVMRVLNGSSRM